MISRRTRFDGRRMDRRAVEDVVASVLKLLSCLEKPWLRGNDSHSYIALRGLILRAVRIMYLDLAPRVWRRLSTRGHYETD